MESEWVKRIQKIANEQKMPEAGRILGERIRWTEKMREAARLWKRVYENDAPWLEGGRVKGMNLLPVISGEVARLAVLEMGWRVEGSDRAAFLNRQIGPVRHRLRRYLEYAVGKGGLVLKPYLVQEEIQVEMVQPDGFIPLETGPDGQIIGAVFTESLWRDKRFFTRLEEHRMTDKGVLVLNRAFVSNTAGLWEKKSR